MANILEFLRRVLTDEPTQKGFRDDPTGFLREQGFADLTGEDVAEAVGVLRNVLSAPAADSLAPFASREMLPGVRPEPGESGLDAAARMLRFALDRLPANGSEPPAPSGPLLFSAATPEPDVAVEAPPEPEPVPEPAPQVPEALAPVTLDLGTLPSVAAFAASLDESAADARKRYDESLQQFAEMSARHAQEVAERLSGLLQQAHDELNELRSSNEAEIAQLRADAVADRDARRAALDTAESEAQAMLEHARRESEELLAAARAEAEGTRRELEARRGELRDAEAQLKERLTGIDSLFRKVLEPDATPEAPPDGQAAPGGPS
jgi:transcription elongation GreA/GreB family factor